MYSFDVYIQYYLHYIYIYILIHIYIYSRIMYIYTIHIMSTRIETIYTYVSDLDFR